MGYRIGHRHTGLRSAVLGHLAWVDEMERVGSIHRMVVEVNRGEVRALLEQMERDLEASKQLHAKVAQRHKELIQDLADIRLICTTVCDQLIENGVVDGLSDLSADEALQLILDNKQKRLEQEKAEEKWKQQCHVAHLRTTASEPAQHPKKDDDWGLEL